MKGAPAVLLLPSGLRSDRRGAAEMMQVMQAVLVAIVCVGVVFAALSVRTSAANDQQATARAENQAALVLEAIPRDPALTAGGGVIAWSGAVAVSSGALALAFVPQRICAVSVQDVESGVGLFLQGSVDSLGPHCVFARRPVPISMGDGTTHAGLLTAGVARE